MRVLFLIAITMLFFSCQSETDQMNSSSKSSKIAKTDKKSPTFIMKLPKQMKGYEFYTWKQDNDWHFCLITGTNRLKTAKEITPIEEKIEDKWVKITVKGIDKAKRMLQRLESGTSLFGGNLYKDQPALDKKVQDELIKFAKSLKINLMF